MTEPAGLTLETALELFKLASLIGGGAFVVFRLGRTTSRVELAIAAHSTDMLDIKADIKELGKLMVTVAVQGQRMDALSNSLATQSERMNRMDQRWDEIRHGKGLITD